MALTREERKLLHQKSKQPTLGSGKPDTSEGFEGDISFRKVSGSGTVQYLKQDGDWIPISSSGTMPESRPVGSSSRSLAFGEGTFGSSGHGELTGLEDDDHTQYLLIDGTRAMTGDLSLSGGDGALTFTVAGENSIKIPDNQASALIIEEANTAYLTFTTTDSGEKIQFHKALDIDAVSDFGSNAMTNVNIDSGAIDGTTIGSSSHSTIKGTTIDATTDFTIGGTVITDAQIADDGDFTIDAAGDIILDAAGGEVFIKSASSTDAILQFKIGSTVRHMIGIDADDDDALRFHGPGPTQLAANCNMVLDGSGIQLGGGNITFNDDEINIDNDTTGRLNIYNAGLGLHINTPVPFNSGSGEMGHSDDRTTFDSFALRWKTLTGGTYNGQHIAGGESDYKNNYAMVGASKISTRYADHTTSFVLQS